MSIFVTTSSPWSFSETSATTTILAQVFFSTALKLASSAISYLMYLPYSSNSSNVEDTTNVTVFLAATSTSSNDTTNSSWSLKLYFNPLTFSPSAVTSTLSMKSSASRVVPPATVHIVRVNPLTNRAEESAALTLNLDIS